MRQCHEILALFRRVKYLRIQTPRCTLLYSTLCGEESNSSQCDSAQFDFAKGNTTPVRLCLVWNCTKSDSTQRDTAPSQTLCSVILHHLRIYAAWYCTTQTLRSVILNQVRLYSAWYCMTAGNYAVWYCTASDSVQSDTARSQTPPQCVISRSQTALYHVTNFFLKHNNNQNGVGRFFRSQRVDSKKFCI